MAEELVELTAAIQHELELARSGDGYEEEAAVAGEIVERMVAPMLAARNAFFDQRLSDFREEYRKSLESWDRQRARLLGDLEHMEEENGQLRREVNRLRREVEFEALGTNPSRDDSMALEELETDFHDRAQRRAESGGDSPQCDGDCDNSDCHMTSAVAAWQMAAAAVRRRINELDAGPVPQCAVHPDGEAA